MDNPEKITTPIAIDEQQRILGQVLTRCEKTRKEDITLIFVDSLQFVYTHTSGIILVSPKPTTEKKETNLPDISISALDFTRALYAPNRRQAIISTRINRDDALILLITHEDKKVDALVIQSKSQMGQKHTAKELLTDWLTIMHHKIIPDKELDNNKLKGFVDSIENLIKRDYPTGVHVEDKNLIKACDKLVDALKYDPSKDSHKNLYFLTRETKETQTETTQTEIKLTPEQIKAIQNRHKPPKEQEIIPNAPDYVGKSLEEFRNLVINNRDRIYDDIENLRRTGLRYDQIFYLLQIVGDNFFDFCSYVSQNWETEQIKNMNSRYQKDTKEVKKRIAILNRPDVRRVAEDGDAFEAFETYSGLNTSLPYGKFYINAYSSSAPFMAEQIIKDTLKSGISIQIKFPAQLGIADVFRQDTIVIYFNQDPSGHNENGTLKVLKNLTRDPQLRNNLIHKIPWFCTPVYSPNGDVIPGVSFAVESKTSGLELTHNQSIGRVLQELYWDISGFGFNKDYLPQRTYSAVCESSGLDPYNPAFLRYADESNPSLSPTFPIIQAMSKQGHS